MESRFQVRACLVMQFDDLLNVCPIHIHRLFPISSSAGSWNAVLALPILAFTSASEPPCSSMMLLSYANNSLRSLDAFHEDGHSFGKCLSCDKFPFFKSCKFCNSKCFKCGDIKHTQSICSIIVHLAATNIKPCNSDSVKSSVSNEHFSLSLVSKDSVESFSSSELKETQNSCEIRVSNQSTDQISHVIVPDMIFPNDSLITDEIPYKSEGNMVNEPSHDQKPDAVLMDADFFNDHLLCNDIHNKLEETVSEESRLDVIPNIIFFYNAFVSCEKRVQCEAQVLDNLDFD
ncbi:unnamed protein product [Schistosoma margrebowiei]|uniref:Uncharacterized protein n=1 Tax=Schistosoma margrebowiei TaxID=48269 RepID=A0A183LUP0_9TREM|nr:unnamed protein product [Schistosoma margrebowiei]